jgi:hypothetical protein
MAVKPKETFTISVHPQGVHLANISRQELKTWIENEMRFYSDLEPISATQLHIANSNYGRSERLPKIQTQQTKILKHLNDSDEYAVVDAALNAYLEPARNMLRLIADGVQGKRLLDLSSSGKQIQAHLPLLVFSNDYVIQHAAVQSAVELHRTMWMSPFPATFSNLYSAISANDASEKAERIMRSELAEVKQLAETQQQEMGRLHELYHEKLMIEAPASNWQTISDERTTQWRVWLGVFVAALVFPAGVLIWHSVAIVNLLASLSPKEGPFSVAGLAVVTAPALLYAWMLRQVSRIYTRSFDLAVDAKHRKALATTYLGLAENTKIGVTQTDRAIVLQALFRPQPPHTSDDGPPIGLIELLKSKD